MLYTTCQGMDAGLCDGTARSPVPAANERTTCIPKGPCLMWPSVYHQPVLAQNNVSGVSGQQPSYKLLSLALDSCSFTFFALLPVLEEEKQKIFCLFFRLFVF